MNLLPQIPVDCTSCVNRLTGSFPLSIVILYNDISAALRAAEMVERLGRQHHGKLQIQLKPVRLESLADTNVYDHTLEEGTEADIIIVSVNGLSALPTTLKKWLKDCQAQRQNAGAAMVAILGSQEKMDAVDSPRLQFLQRSAQSMGLNFFAPNIAAPKSEEDCYFEDTYFSGASENCSVLSAS